MHQKLRSGPAALNETQHAGKWIVQILVLQAERRSQPLVARTFLGVVDTEAIQAVTPAVLVPAGDLHQAEVRFLPRLLEPEQKDQERNLALLSRRRVMGTPAEIDVPEVLRHKFTRDSGSGKPRANQFVEAMVPFEAEGNRSARADRFGQNGGTRHGDGRIDGPRPAAGVQIQSRNRLHATGGGRMKRAERDP